MTNWIWRGVVLLWAAFFAIVGLRGLFDPASYSETFSFSITGVAINTLRADLSAFFIVASGGGGNRGAGSGLGARLAGTRGTVWHRICRPPDRSRYGRPNQLGYHPRNDR